MAFVWTIKSSVGARLADSRTSAQVAQKTRWLLALGGLFAGAAFAQSTDILVNHDGQYAGADASFGPAGGTFTYIAKVKHNNVGPTASGVVLTEKLPLDSIFQSYSSAPAGIVCAPALAAGTVITAGNQTQSCSVGTLAAADGFKSVSFNVILPSVSTNWEAFASATHSAADSDVNNNTNLSRNFTTRQASDLGIALTAAPNSVSNGGAFSYKINVTNNGPTAIPAAGRVVVSFPVPNGAILSSDPSGNGWQCTPSSGYPITSGTLVCSYPGSAGVGVGAVLTELTVPAIANMSGTISGAASVSGFQNAGSSNSDLMEDGQSANNTANTSVTSSGGNFVDVSLTKTVSPGTVDAAVSSVVTYTLKPRREAGSTAPYGMHVTDTLPAGVTSTGFVSLDPSWNCSASTATVIDCTHTSTAGSPYTGGNFTDMPFIRFTAVVAAGATGPVENVGVIELPPALAEPNTANNTGKISVNRSNTAQLSLVKTAPARPVKAGENFTFNLAVKNNGPVNILAGQSINVTESPGVGLNIVSMTVADPIPANWTCGSITACAYTGGLANGATLNVTVTANVSAAAGSFATFGNSAGAGVVGRDGNIVNSSATVIVSNETADVGIEKTITSGVGPIVSGDEVTYRLRVTNNGATTVTNVTVTDALNNLVREDEGGTIGSPAAPRYPNGGFVSAAGVGAICPTPSGTKNSDNRTLTCTIASIAAGASVDIEVKIRPKVAASGNYSNTASAKSSDINDNNPANDSDSAVIASTAIVDLVALKQVSPTTAAAGEPLTFTATVRNDGPSSAQNVTLVDPLPPNAIIIEDPVVSDAGTCTKAGGAAAIPPTAGGTLNCSWPAAVTSRSQRTVTVKMRSSGDLPDNTIVLNKIKVATTTAEFTTANNEAEAQATLTRAELDVSISMSHSADGLLIGEDTEYTIVVTNGGPSYATNVVVTDTFPTDLSVGVPSSATFSYQGGLTQTGATATCTEPAVGATSGPLTCTVPVLPPLQSVTIRFKMKAQSLPAGASTGTIYHRATVKPAEVEYLRNGNDVIVNNSTTDRTSTSVTANNVDLGVVKQGPDGPLDDGDAVAYTLTVTNYGRDAQSPLGATLTDVLPAGLDYVSADARCTYVSGTRTVTCSVPQLAQGAQTVFMLNTRIAKPYTGARPLVNNVSVSVPGDGNPGNNTSRKETKLKPPPGGVAGIPTLSEWGVILLSTMLALLALRDAALRRRR
ncbi:IPTL-CTERM sorting domain-containing protein [Acidovorax radicis]|uniref:IPTL-CTERM sorting domain-containing protein n=1 Tax=Acidovorax radicis TaxID=758826 RepID=UPI001CFA766E|nr:IPTL-CTERM sorting domain-containing protein [Acidovorax radicis]UCU99740.1 IPTL-CTERM sorting domain-containing protein [Acidovorax radicis]